MAGRSNPSISSPSVLLSYTSPLYLCCIFHQHCSVYLGYCFLSIIALCLINPRLQVTSRFFLKKCHRLSGDDLNLTPLSNILVKWPFLVWPFDRSVYIPGLCRDTLPSISIA